MQFIPPAILKFNPTSSGYVRSRWFSVKMFYTQEVDHDGVSEQQRKSHQHPGEKRGLEVQEAEEVHAYERMPPTPHVHQHDDEGLTQEEDVGEQTEQLHVLRLNTTHHFVMTEKINTHVCFG